MRFVCAALPAAICALTISFAARAEDLHAYGLRCRICHQANGRGIPGMYPPLAGTIGRYASVPTGRAYIIAVVLNGMGAPITSDGMMYAGLMPQFAYLGDAEIAEAINEALTGFNAALLAADFAPIDAAEVKSARAPSRSSADLARERAAIIAQIAHPAPAGAHPQ